MKLFRDKNRGPKVKSEDVVIPEEYLAYEREAEARKRLEAQEAEAAAEKAADKEAFAQRVEELLTTSREKIEAAAAADSADQVADMAPDIDDAEPPVDEAVIDEAVASEPEPETDAAAPRARGQKKPRKAREKKAADDDLPLGFKVLLVAIVLTVATVVVLLGPLMRIDHVQVNNLHNLSEAQVVEIAGNPIGQNLFLYSLSEAEEELSYYPYVEEVSISRRFPHWLEITITEREPAGVLLNNGSYLQFSKDGVLLDNTATLTHQSLPLITGFSMEEVPSPGEAFKDNARFSDILKLVNACTDELLTMIQEINIRDRDNILAYTSQGIEIRIGNVDNIETRMAALNDIMNQVILSGMIEEPIEAIDIRYEKSPVVVLEGYDNVDVSSYVSDEDTDEGSDSGDDTAASDSDNADNSSDSSDESSSETTQ